MAEPRHYQTSPRNLACIAAVLAGVPASAEIDGAPYKVLMHAIWPERTNNPLQGIKFQHGGPRLGYSPDIDDAVNTLIHTGCLATFGLEGTLARVRRQEFLRAIAAEELTPDEQRYLASIGRRIPLVNGRN